MSINKMEQTVKAYDWYEPSKNPFIKTIEVCGCRACIKCAGTGNENFPNGGQTTSDNYYPCATCKGTGKETYFETKPNPYYGQTKDIIDKAIDAYKYKKEVEQICVNLMKIENLKLNIIETYKTCIKTYEDLGGDNPIIHIAKAHIKRLERTNGLVNFNNKIEKYKKEAETKLTQEKITSYKNALTILERNSESAFDKKIISSSRNILKDIEESCMKKAILNPVPEGTFKIPPPKTFEHIPNLHKPQTPAITIKPVKWNEWNDFESDNGGFVDIMGRHSEMWGRAMAEQEKISWMRQFVSEYRKYAEHCKSQGVEPVPIPNEDVLRRRLEWITLSDGSRIYNKHYDPPGCCIM